jgi:hypothetical protein
MRGAAPLAIVFALATSPAPAGGNCDLARQVGRLDVSSRLLLRETEPGNAARIVTRLAGDLRAVTPPAAAAPLPQPGSPQAMMRDYIGSRETLVQVFDDRGLPAAQDFLRADTTAQAIRDIEAELDCDAPPGSATPGTESSPAAGLQLGERVANGALAATRRHSGATIEENWTVPLFALPALALTIVLLSRLLNRRQDTRYPCDIPAGVTLRDAMLSAHIADMSRGGAKLRTNNAAGPGMRGALHLDSGEVLEFRVAWANAHFIGVTFLHPLEISPKRLLGL